MLRITSIRKFLLIAIAILISLGWTVSAVLNFRASQEQVEELFDAELAQMSRILQAMITSNPALSSSELSHSLEYLNKDILAQDYGHKEYTILGHKYEQKLSFHAWTEQGKMVLESHTQLPQSFTQLKPGFHPIIDNQLIWRSFTLQDKRSGFWIQVAQREDVRTELTNEIAWHSTLPSLLFLPFLIIVTGLIIQRGLSPLSTISNELKGRDYNNLGSLNDADYPVELKHMVSELNKLFKRVSESHLRERRFTADAAHELRTPLAISKIHLQNIQQISENPKVHEFVGKALIGIERLIHMVQQLLILSRLDAQLEHESETSVDVVKVCEELIQEIGDSASFSNIAITTQLPDRFELLSSETSLRILLRNLLDNACRYANPESQVEVVIENSSLTIRNLCPHLDHDALENIFGRFTRGNSRQQQGSGLGLSICQRICQQYGFTLTLKNRLDTHENYHESREKISQEGIITTLVFSSI